MSEVENFCPYMCDHSSMCFWKCYNFRKFSGHVKLNLSQRLCPQTPTSRFSYHLSLRPWYHHASGYTTAPLGLSQIYSKICPKCFQVFPKYFTYFASQCSYYACIMLLSCQQFLTLSWKF